MFACLLLLVVQPVLWLAFLALADNVIPGFQISGKGSYLATVVILVVTNLAV